MKSKELKKSNDKYEVIFSSSNINFVKLSSDLVQDYLKMVGDPYVARFIFYNDVNITEEDEIKYVNSKLKSKDFIFSMLEKKTNKFIGNIELKNVKKTNAELGVCITYSMQDKHYGSEAIRKFLDYSFEKFKLEKIYLKVFPDNLRAIHVYEKIGFKRYDRRDNDVYMMIKNMNKK